MKITFNETLDLEYELELSKLEESISLKRKAHDTVFECVGAGYTAGESLMRLVPSCNLAKFGHPTWPIVEAVFFLELCFQAAKRGGNRNVN